MPNPALRPRLCPIYSVSASPVQEHEGSATVLDSLLRPEIVVADEDGKKILIIDMIIFFENW